VTPLQERLLERIRSGGPMPFAAYMSLALYDPQHGYYASSERTGWSGDFVTSSVIDPAFGALWARAFEQIWEACGRPATFEVIEVGPGEGRFAADVLDAVTGHFADALTYRLVERMGAARKRQEHLFREHRYDGDLVRWSASITDLEPVDAGLVFANEVLDNLPVHLVQQHHGKLAEVCVGADGHDLVEMLLPLSNPELGAFFERHGAVIPEGHRAEVALAAESFCAHAARAIGRGAIVIVDYGAMAGDLVGRPEGTLVCYSSSGADASPLERPGEKDITAHANWSAVLHALKHAGMDVSGPRPQSKVLIALGLTGVDAELKRDHDDAIAAGRGADAVKAFSRRHALRALSDRSGLGGFDVVAGFRGITAPDAFGRSV